ncbi:MAG: hypothetical protein D6706_21025, partial [Chloroflexi bacterium]
MLLGIIKQTILFLRDMLVLICAGLVFLAIVRDPSLLRALPLSPPTQSVQDTEMFDLIMPYEPGSYYVKLNNGFHGDGYWQGVDFIAACGTQLVAPISGEVVDVGRDSYCGQFGCGNTYLHIRNESWDVMFLHGLYTVEPGQIVTIGEPIGVTASIGNSSECHDHISLRERPNGRLVDIEHQASVSRVQKPVKPLKISTYDPAEGGINCDHDCSVLADGTQFDVSLYWNTAACPADWIGRTVAINGIGTFKCRDTGGAIKEHEDFIWIDLMIPSAERPPQTMSLVYD